jgi:recombination protein RecA
MPAKKKATPPSSQLEGALADIQRKRGMSIGTVTEAARPIEVLSSGNIALDFVTGVGGFPRGRIVELFGTESTGKTTAALQAAAEARRRGLAAAYFDFENAMDADYVRALGLDPDDPMFVYSTPDTAEDGINALRDLLRTGQLAVGVVDSVAAMVSEKEMEADTGSSSALAAKAKMMAQSMRQMTGLANRHGTILMFVNHEQEVIDTSPMGQMLRGVDRVTTPGGRALKFHASLRLRFQIIGKVQGADESPLAKPDKPTKTPYANTVKVTVAKNKVGPPFRKAELRLVYGKGFDQSWSVLNILLAGGRAKKSGAWYDVVDLDTGEMQRAQGEQAALKLVEQNLDAYATEALRFLEEVARPPTPEEIAAYEAEQARQEAALSGLEE